MDNTAYRTAEGLLRREITLIALVAIMIGLNVGGSLFALTSIAAGQTGPSLFIAQILSALPILLALIPYLMLSSSLPTTCANYQYAKLFSRPMAVAAWMTLFIAIPIGALPLFAVITSNFLQELFPAIPIMPTAIAVISIFFLLNVFGIKPTIYVQLATVVVLLVAILIFIVPGVPAIKAENMQPLFPGGPIGFIGASALLFTLLAGGLFGIEVGSEVKNASSVIPRALIISMFAVLAVYILLEVVAVGVMDWQLFAEQESLKAPAATFLSGFPLGFFIAGGGILASITTINLILTIAGRYAMVFAIDGYFPKIFSRISKKFGTPHWGITLTYVMTIITLIINPPLIVLGQMLNFGLLFMITLVLFSAYKFPRKYPELYEKSRYKFSPRTIRITSLSAICINIVFMLVLAYGMITSDNARWTFPLFVIAAIAGLIVYFVRKRQGVVPVDISKNEQN
jgi:basic amino acid/polyamine antiporter, APA family